MKKIIARAALVALMSLPFTAFAQETIDTGELTSGTNVIGPTGSTSATLFCVLLDSTINVNLSNRVQGAYRCSEAYGVARMATCHEAGSRAGTTVPCVFTVDPEGATTYNGQTGSWNGSTCAAPTDTFEVSTRRYFYATTAGGGVSTRTLPDAVGCTSAAALTAVQQ